MFVTTDSCFSMAKGKFSNRKYIMEKNLEYQEQRTMVRAQIWMQRNWSTHTLQAEMKNGNATLES